MNVPSDDDQETLIDSSHGAGTNNSNKSRKKDNDHFTQDLKKYINFTNTKYIAILLTTFFVFYHGYLNSLYGRNSCNRLLGQGHIKSDNEWQPFGCMIHKYTQNDVETCFKYVKYYNGKNNFIFIGDSRIRQVYISFISKLDGNYEFRLNDSKIITQIRKTKRFLTTESLNVLNNNQNLYYTNEQLNFEANFIWKPTVDESLNNLIESFLQPGVSRPNMIIMGMASNYMLNNGTREALDSFKSNLSSLVDFVKSLDYETSASAAGYSNSNQFTSKYDDSLLPNANDADKHGIKSTSIYWMLQDPIDELKYSPNDTSPDKLNNKQIDLYNRASINLLYYSPIKIWSSSRLVSQAYNKDSPDGFHIGPYALAIDSQIMFNLYCNNRMNFNDASCCSQPEQISLLQRIIFSVFIICFLMTTVLFFYKNFCKNHSNFRLNISGSEISLTTTCKNAASSYGFYNLLTTLSKLAMIMLYFYACDRANYFMKENRHFSYLTFFVPLIYVSVVGIFFQDNLSFPKVMNRHQTSELKGFMQLVILLFQISAGYKSVPLFLLIRLFTSAYLFLSGYGHFMYYWHTSNYNLARFFQVLFRLNFLPILLCFTMNRMYQFYTFIPLVTFWYICGYILMFVYPNVSAKSAKDNPHEYLYMFIKLACFGALITTLNMSEVLFEKIFVARPWKFLFVGSDDMITDWRHRWSIDRYSFLFGMCFALLVCLLKRFNYIDDYENNLDEHDEDSLDFRERRRLDRPTVSLKSKLILILISFGGILFYYLFSVLCESKENCDNYTTFITLIPIISYFILKNTIECFKETYSYVFCWFGQISLELFVCSYHIWLAADSNGILVLLPGFPVVNMLLSTFIFICICHELNQNTKFLSQYVVPNNWRICLRNFLSFVILLMPIAIKYGYI